MRRKYDHAKLTQSSCLLEGLCICFVRTSGNFAVIIHSYRDCANVLPTGSSGLSRDPGRFFCTNLRESDVMAGATMDRLIECVKLVAELEKPAAVYVFGSCLSELIGDDMESGLEEAAKEISVPVIPVTSSGLDDISQKKVIDRHAYLMYRAAEAKLNTRPFSVNLIGFPEGDGKIEDILEASGIEINVHLNEMSPMSAWRNLPAGALNAVIDKELFSTLTERMRKERGTPFIEAPLPTGLSGTDAFLLKIASHFKKRDEVKKILDESELAESRGAAEAAVSAHAAEWKGMKLAYCIGTDRNYIHCITAKHGLCEVNFFRELGFDVTILIQGSPDPSRVLLITRLLREMKIAADFDIFVDNVSLTPALRKRTYDLVYCVKAMAEMVRPTKVPMIDIGSLKTGYDGCIRNIALIEKALSGRHEREAGG